MFLIPLSIIVLLIFLSSFTHITYLSRARRSPLVSQWRFWLSSFDVYFKIFFRKLIMKLFILPPFHSIRQQEVVNSHSTGQHNNFLQLKQFHGIFFTVIWIWSISFQSLACWGSLSLTSTESSWQLYLSSSAVDCLRVLFVFIPTFGLNGSTDEKLCPMSLLTLTHVHVYFVTHFFLSFL